MSNTMDYMDEYMIEEKLEELNTKIVEISEKINSYIPKIIGSHIYNKILGCGTIENIDDGLMNVDFDGMKKGYKYPLPLSTTMEFDEDKLKIWGKIFALTKKIDSLEAEKSRLLIKLNTAKSSPKDEGIVKKPIGVSKAMNVIYKANYNDGGRDRSKLGFDGVCSDEIIKYNVYERKRSWCSNECSDCYKYLNGQMTREELDDKMIDGYVCYDSKLLSDFSVEAGIKYYANGEEKPIRILKAGIDKLCVMTTVEPGKDTEDAIVFGMFIIGDVFVGTEYESGELSCNPDYCLTFSPKEARQFKLWEHYHNANSREKKWGSGLLRYATDDMAISFLKKAIELKRGTADKKQAIEMYKYFCEKNGIWPDLQV